MAVILDNGTVVKIPELTPIQKALYDEIEWSEYQAALLDHAYADGISFRVRW